jgi:hypothetical protein
MSLTRKFLPVLALVGAAFTATPALADPITLTAASVGQSYTFNMNGFNGSTDIAGLTSTLTLTLQSVADTAYTFGYNLANTTAAPLTSRVTGFGFNTDPNIGGAAATGTFQYVMTNINVPNGIGNIDVALNSGCLSSCSGSGVAAGNTGLGTLTLAFCDPITSLTLDNFFVRYQSITGAGSITSGNGVPTTGTTTGGTTTGGTEVPEPGMLGMMGGALIALAWARTRRRAPAKLAAA